MIYLNKYLIFISLYLSVHLFLDCAWIVYHRLTSEEVDNIATTPISHTIPSYPGYKYNAEMKKLGSYKIAIQTIAEVKAGDEIFISFGNRYWIHSLKNHLNLYKKIDEK